jgi:hypothetical protein
VATPAPVAETKTDHVSARPCAISLRSLRWRRDGEQS